jgi:excisionase family DNA binding protein
MDDPDRTETGATETGAPAAQPGSATVGPLILTVPDAAVLLGISEQAVRKRIAKGTLAATRQGRAWRVILDGPAPAEATATGATATTQPRPQPDIATGATSAPRPTTDAERFAALAAPFVAPWVERVEALAREAEARRQEAAVLAARLEQAEAERDRLRDEVERLRSGSAGDAPVTHLQARSATEPHREGIDATPARSTRPWWKVWQRLPRP